MAGVTLTAKLDAMQAITGLTAVREMALHPRPLLRQIGVYLVASTQARFGTGKDPQGNAWAPLLPAYAAIKRGPSILVGSGMSGGLQGSITFDTSNDAVMWGSNKISAAVHQFGATIVPKVAPALRFRLVGGWVSAQSVTVPARPYLGLSREDEEEIAWLSGRFARKLLAGAPR